MHRTPRSQPLPSFMRGTSKSSYLIYFHERSINVIASVFFSAWPVRKAALSLERWCVTVLVEYLWEIFQLTNFGMPIFKSLTGRDLSESPARSLTPISHETDISHLAPEGIAIKSFSTFVPTSQFGLSQILFGHRSNPSCICWAFRREIEFNIELNFF